MKVTAVSLFSHADADDDILINETYSEHLWEVRFHPSGKYCVVCGSEPVIHFVVCCSNNKQEKEWKVLGSLDVSGVHGKRTVRSVDFSSCGRYMATASFGSSVAVWVRDGRNVWQWKQIAVLEGHENEVKSIRWSKKGSPFLATCGRDKSVWIWERISYLDDNEDLIENDGNGGDDYFVNYTLDDDDDDDDHDQKDENFYKKNKKMLSNSAAVSCEFECLAVLQEHSQDVKALDWNPKVPLLASCSYDGSVRLWRQDEMEEDWFCSHKFYLEENDANNGEYSTVWEVCFSPQGNLLAAVTENGQIFIISSSLTSSSSNLASSPWHLLNVISPPSDNFFKGLSMYSISFYESFDKKKQLELLVSPCSLKRSEIVRLSVSALGVEGENFNVTLEVKDKTPLNPATNDSDLLCSDINHITVWNDIVAAVSDNNNIFIIQ